MIGHHFTNMPTEQLDHAIVKLEDTIDQLTILRNGQRLSEPYRQALDQARAERERRTA